MVMTDITTYGRMWRRAREIFGAALVIAVATTAAQAGPVLDRVKRDGQVRCGVDQTAGFSEIDDSGRATGFEVDFCRAVAAARALAASPSSSSLSSLRWRWASIRSRS